MKVFHHAYWLQYLSGVEFEDHRWELISRQAEQMASIIGPVIGATPHGAVLLENDEIGVDQKVLPEKLTPILQDCIQKAGTIHFDSALQKLRGFSS